MIHYGRLDYFCSLLNLKTLAIFFISYCNCIMAFAILSHPMSMKMMLLVIVILCILPFYVLAQIYKQLKLIVQFNSLQSQNQLQLTFRPSIKWWSMVIMDIHSGMPRLYFLPVMNTIANVSIFLGNLGLLLRSPKIGKTVYQSVSTGQQNQSW